MNKDIATAAIPQSPRRPRLPALTGVRILAALHIYLFHLKQAHDAGLVRFGGIAALPKPLAEILGRGYVSTGFFFLLSGFLLAYAYIGGNGTLKQPVRAFWKGRFVRLYPLYLISLLVLLPAPALLPITGKSPSLGEALGGIFTSLTLIQAWFPDFALWWNAPAWALSAFAAFYVVFPRFARLTAGLSANALLRLAIVLSVVSWLPAVVYLALNPEGNAWTATPITRGGFWLNVLRFDPLTWLPQFLSGMMLGRFFAKRVDAGEAIAAPRLRAGIGDAAVVFVAVLLAVAPPIPYVLLRHGLLTPLFLVIVYDLARQRGILAHIVSGRILQRGAEASFSLFALQMPVGVWFSVFIPAALKGSNVHLLGMIAATLAVSLAWSEFAQARIAGWFSGRSAGSKPSVTTSPGIAAPQGSTAKPAQAPVTL